jgi:hypothetical protein
LVDDLLLKCLPFKNGIQQEWKGFAPLSGKAKKLYLDVVAPF